LKTNGCFRNGVVILVATIGKRVRHKETHSLAASAIFVHRFNRRIDALDCAKENATQRRQLSHHPFQNSFSAKSKKQQRYLIERA